jgi:Na+-driven multidrug efflux pump
MNRTIQLLLIAAIAISIAIVSAVCWHSLGEIHYLKSFFPRQFTVEEAFYASAVELIKVLIISLPFVLVTATALYFLRHFKRER